MIPPDPLIPPPRIAVEPYVGPTRTIEEVCARARVPYRYSGGLLPQVATASGAGTCAPSRRTGVAC